MDGINGIAGIAGVVAFGLLALFCMTSGVEEALVALSICIGLACVGFLPFNMPRARVFMGDVGSILLGFVFAAMVVGLACSVNDFLVLCSFLFPFYADEFTTEFVRLRGGENLFTPHRRHVYQLLANETGIAHWKVSVGYGVLQALVGLGALLLHRYGVVTVTVFLGGCLAAFLGFGYRVRLRVKRGDTKLLG
jgi:UDP-N-acetylmuramyl pentapeptide phosphotransferase/UDP-N-acetylglucosamine-1-phosphate transferase